MTHRRTSPSAHLERKFTAAPPAGLVLDDHPGPDGGLSPDGSFSGYASLFGLVDLGRDRVMPGAFAQSLARRGTAGIRLLWQHDPAQPIGVWTEIREDSRGLFVRGQLSPGVAQGREAMVLIRQGAIDGLSIGFRTARSRKDAAGVRELLEIDLWEISLVTFPMLPDARVLALKGAMSARLAALIRRAARELAGGSLPRPA